LLYSWIIDGAKLTDFEQLNLKVLFESKYEDDISKLSNNANGIYISFTESGILPSGISLRIFVGNKFNNNEFLNVYYYDKNTSKLELLNNNLDVKDGYIEFSVKELSDRFITNKKIENNGKKDIPLYGFIFIGILMILVAIIIFILVYKKSRKNKKAI